MLKKKEREKIFPLTQRGFVVLEILVRWRGSWDVCIYQIPAETLATFPLKFRSLWADCYKLGNDKPPIIEFTLLFLHLPFKNSSPKLLEKSPAQLSRVSKTSHLDDSLALWSFPPALSDDFGEISSHTQHRGWQPGRWQVLMALPPVLMHRKDVLSVCLVYIHAKDTDASGWGAVIWICQCSQGADGIFPSWEQPVFLSFLNSFHLVTLECHFSKTKTKDDQWFELD